MSARRIFLGWDAPVVRKVGAFLLPEIAGGAVDLGGDLVVVPTRQAGRRLREHLARRCAEKDAVLLSARVVTPSFFLQPGRGAAGAANPLQVRAAWTAVWNRSARECREALFPFGGEEFVRGAGAGEQIDRLRQALAEGGYLIRDVVASQGDGLPEKERWEALSRLEQEYLALLESLGLEDPCAWKIHRASDPSLPADLRRVVLAAVPDPTLLTLRALERLAPRAEVAVLIAAPESCADGFDAWGRPLPVFWQRERIDLPDPEGSLRACASPAAQARAALREIAAEAGRWGPGDIVLGVPDGDVTPCLQAELAAHGLPAFDPSDASLREHPICQALVAIERLAREGSTGAFADLLRQADLLLPLANRESGPPSAARLLAEFDAFRAERLPAAFDACVEALADGPDRAAYPLLAEAAGRTIRWIEAWQASDFEGSVRNLLTAVHAGRELLPGEPGDEAFLAAAGVVDRALAEWEGGWTDAFADQRIDLPGLFMARLRQATRHRGRDGALIALEGWLELPWSDEPFLLVTGMNEGRVPDGRSADAFLPDSLRTRLGLRDDAGRLARDVFLMRGLIEARRCEGRVCLFTGRMSASGDPLKPSRLLFRCADAGLPARAAFLLGPTEPEPTAPPAGIGFRLRPPPPAAAPERRLSVTAFRDYLACPFRFYLKHELGMREQDPDLSAPDALAFGLMIHHALERMSKDPSMGGCADPGRLASFLAAEAGAWTDRRYGRRRLLSVDLALEAARHRLASFAGVQVGLLDEGWETVAVEKRLETIWEGCRLVGRIDRIDRHRESGRIRVYDVKTSDAGENPAQTHLRAARGDVEPFRLAPGGGRPRQWKDLQLPLYHLLLEAEGRWAPPYELATFNLPSAVSDTGVVAWEEWSDDLLESARRCALEVVRRVRSGRFWPPAERVPWDPYERLFPADPSACIDASLISRLAADGEAC